MLVELSNTPRPYEWGDSHSLATWQGRLPASGPEAELWWGTHLGSPAGVIGQEGESETLSSWLANSGYATELPYLVKLLAAGKPLSIQVHPSKEQASRGFALENEAGIPLEAPSRNFRDTSDKPELLISWCDTFEALVGFKHLPEIRKTLKFIDQVTREASLTSPFREALRGGIAGGVKLILSEDEAVSDLAGAITEAVELERGQKIPERTSAVWGLWKNLVKFFPNDKGIVVASFLNHLTLGRGDAVFVPAGVVHAYLKGFGLEIMSPSDNVLRGGLTKKHVDRQGLGDIVVATPTAPELFSSPEIPVMVRTLAPEGAPFLVTSYQSSAEGLLDGQGPWTIVVESGNGLITVGQWKATISAGKAYALSKESGGSPAILKSNGLIYVIEPNFARPRP